MKSLKFKERRPTIVATSALMNIDVKDKCLSTGFDFFSNIPISKHFLLNVFKRVDTNQARYDEIEQLNKIDLTK